VVELDDRGESSGCSRNTPTNSRLAWTVMYENVLRSESTITDLSASVRTFDGSDAISVSYDSRVM
jgi:hypothetical protein